MADALSLGGSMPAGRLTTDARAAFVVRTYLHLLGAVIGFTVLQVLSVRSGVGERLASAMREIPWLWILGAFMIVAWLASRTAHRVSSRPAQYAALAAFVVGKSILFVPLLYEAQAAASGVIESAVLVTLIGFSGLTAVAWSLRKDFSFLGGLLRWGMVVALVVLVASAVFGFRLGALFSVAMVALAGAAILYDTSKVLRHFPQDRYVAAALELFASVALMFWHVLRLVTSGARS